MRRHLIPLLLCLPLLGACHKEQPAQALPAETPVLAFGDSLTEGYGVQPEASWPALLAEKTGWQVSNGGVSGDTTEKALRRLPGLLQRTDPALVLIALGGNDMLRKVPREQTVANLEQAIAQVRQHGARPVLLATPQPSIAGAVFQSLSAPAFYREIAEAENVPLIEDAIADVLSDPRLKVDQLHPNTEGHALLAEKIYEELKIIGYVSP